MYEYLFGKVTSISDNYVILEVNSVGYKIYITNVENIKLNYFVKLFIHYYFSDSIKQLYGFSNKIEKEIFSKLIEIKKIGVKTAFLILKNYHYENILKYIEDQDEESLIQIPKITNENVKLLIQKFSGFKYENSFDINEEVLSILRSLDYEDKDIFKVYKNINSKKEVNEQVKDAIRLMEGINE